MSKFFSKDSETEGDSLIVPKNPVAMVENENDLPGAELRNRSAESKASRNDSVGSKYEPDPEDAKDRKSVLKGVAGYIVVTEFCERLAYYGFAGSLVLFFQTQLNYTNAEADVQFSAWSGICYVTPLLGGYLADTYLGRYKAILIFSSIYLGGLVLAVLGAIPGHVSPAIFFPAIYIIALGTGGIKPNVSTMGADQFDDRYSMDRLEKESFFNWFYWSINAGALISYTVVAYICQYGAGPDLGGEEWGFFVGYTIPAAAMALAIFIFILGTPKYIQQPPNGSVLGTAISICWEATVTNRQVKTGTEHVLDKAKTSFGGSYSKTQVEGVKLVTRLTPFLLMMVPFWGIYSQMSTSFQNQGCQMNLNVGSVQIPVAALNCFDTGAILLIVPFFDGLVYPYFKKIGHPLSMLEKIGIGFGFALLAMVVAGGIEIARKNYAPASGNYLDCESCQDNITPCQSIDDFNPYNYQDWYCDYDDTDKPRNCHQIGSCNDLVATDNCAETLSIDCIECDDIPQMSDLSVFWQIFQFMLIGTGEILSVITSLEFFYSQAPTAMRSVCQSLNLATTAVGSFLVIPLLLIVNSNPNDEWVPENLDDGHLDYYFFTLAALMGLTMVLFYFVSKGYEYKTTAELKLLDANYEDYVKNHLNNESMTNPVHNSENDSNYEAPKNDN